MVSVRRKITCPTYCSRLHVTQDMAEHLLPRYTEGSTTKVRPAWLHPAPSVLRLHIQESTLSSCTLPCYTGGSTPMMRFAWLGDAARKLPRCVSCAPHLLPCCTIGCPAKVRRALLHPAAVG